jgi:uncharacterized protein (DUF433 family)
MLATAQSVFDQPAYTCSQAAQYLGLSTSTLYGWIADDGLIAPPRENTLSFNNLAEAHVLKAMCRVDLLPLQRIRKALGELAQTRQTSHPLLDEAFETDGVDLCIREEADVVHLSKHSQREIRECVALFLHRIQRNEECKVTRIYPFVVAERADEPKAMSISPTVLFGKPVLAGTGISTSIIAGRFTARDSLHDLAAEYQVDIATLEDVIRWELSKGKAA